MRQGFSLLELLTVLTIVAVISAFAYPSYQNYIVRAHRHDGQAALLDLANRMESYYAEHATYQSVSIKDLLSTDKSLSGWYQLSISQTSDVGYLLEAIPIASQASIDKSCASITLNSQGLRRGTSDSCWR
jgi:type IV pilus assembly protein PilE